jgi:protein-L-isoaspartate O-methyltransferase
MVIPVGDLETQEMIRIKRIDETNFSQSKLGVFSFVPMLENTNNI